ncbi:MAG: transketolase [Planctomycetes bacterium]|nr:transketolase [Planctomycetota bacterium]
MQSDDSVANLLPMNEPEQENLEGSPRLYANAVHARATELCKLVLRMTTQAGAGHPSTAISLAHIVAVLMYEHMRYDPKNPWRNDCDRLVLSEGHAVPIIYAAYADLGGVVGNDPADARPLSIDDLDSLRALASVLDGHPNPAEGFPFFDAATGSLGMGLSVAAGLALAARLDNVDRNVYCLIGDGESREGQVAEALDFIVDHSLGNVCAIFNCNGEGQAGAVSSQQSSDALSRKLSSYGWAATVIDGHDPDQITQALTSFKKSQQPFAILAKTVKGWAVPALLGGNFHGKPLSAGELDAAYQDLDAKRHELAGNAQPVKRASVRFDTDAQPSERKKIKLPSFPQVLEAAGFGAALEKKAIATRRAYGAALAALGEVDDRIVVLDGDVSNSTFANLFAVRCKNRFFESKIAEQNIVSAAVGLAAGGKIPFANSFAKFIARAYDQVELAAISRANIKLVGSHVGLGPASDGPSQMALADVAFFHTLATVDDGRGRPSCVVFQPADGIAAYKMTELMANTPSMCYMRTHRPDAPFIYPLDAEFEVGGCTTLLEGKAITVVATGIMVSEALKACQTLAQDGVECTLIDAYSLPLNADSILESANRTRNMILTVEDNYGGGFGSAVAEAAAKAGRIRVEQLRVRRIPKSAHKPEQLMSEHGLSASAIQSMILQLVNP